MNVMIKLFTVMVKRIRIGNLNCERVDLALVHLVDVWFREL